MPSAPTEKESEVSEADNTEGDDTHDPTKANDPATDTPAEKSDSEKKPAKCHLYVDKLGLEMGDSTVRG